MSADRPLSPAEGSGSGRSDPKPPSEDIEQTGDTRLLAPKSRRGPWELRSTISFDHIRAASESPHTPHRAGCVAT